MTIMDCQKFYDFQEIADSQSMSQLASIAITILKKMSSHGHVHQLCGPMSTGGFNERETNIKLFTNAISVAKEKGLLIFDQIPFQQAMIRLSNLAPQGKYKQDILDLFYLPVFQSGYVNKVLFLPFWETSKGALWERNLLKTIPSVCVEEYPYEWYREALVKSELSPPIIA